MKKTKDPILDCKTEKIRLCKEDYEEVNNLIDNPPEPTPALKELFKE